MADGVTFELKGVDEAIKALNELSGDMRRKVVLQALRDAAKPVAQAAKSFAPVLKAQTTQRVPGTLKRAIGTFKSKRYKAANGQLGVYVTVRATRAQRRRSPISGDPFYFRLVEGGHAKRAGKRRASAGMVKPYPFLGPAFKQEGENALRIFQQAVIERIAKANAAK